MPNTHEIPQEQWAGFLNEFSTTNRGRMARLETDAPSGEGGRILADREPLIGAELDTKSGPSGRITLALGEADSNLMHAITEPQRVWVEEDLDGLARGILIESKDEGKTILYFVLEEALPDGNGGATR